MVDGWPSGGAGDQLGDLVRQRGQLVDDVEEFALHALDGERHAARITAVTRVAPMARLTCQRSSQRTTGLRV
jgi:hypothetical protein